MLPGSCPPADDDALPAPLGAAAWEEARTHKALRETERGLRARLLSIEHDTLQTLQLYAASLRPLPLFANLRAGAWYVPPNAPLTPPPSTSAFKSTDGHYGRWTSSVRRPNAHVLSAARAHGGVVIVDATRAGKAFPDALSKTVPIWCAVVNVLAGLSRCACRSPSGDHCVACAPLHLHPSVPASEADQIRARLPAFVAAWRGVSASLPPAFAHCAGMKPLRAVWTRPGRPTWDGAVPLADLAFTPVVCVSASGSVAGGGGRKYVEPREDVTVCGLHFPQCVGFEHVQGAGDDQEFWSDGMRPEAFWQVREEMLRVARAGGMNADGDVKARVRKVGMQAPGSGVGLGERVWRTRLRVATAPGDAVQFARAVRAEGMAAVMLGWKAPDTEDGREEEEEEARKDVAWEALTDRRGRTEFKYALGRALGRCLSTLRRACVDEGREAVVCGLHAEWAAAVVVAWCAWQCELRDGGFAVAERRDGMAVVEKEHVHGVLMHFASAFPRYNVSRATLKQLNRFFSSPSPPSTVAELA